VAILGLGGIGKTLLATLVARDLAPDFDYVLWRSLRDAPAHGEWLAAAIKLLAPNRRQLNTSLAHLTHRRMGG